MMFPEAHGWSVETLHDDFVQGMREDRLLYDSETPHQRLRLFENARFGRVLTLDGVVQVTEADEFVYHEMIAHVPLLAHGDARRVLVIGGGDGGTVREVLRHPVDAVTLVELDADVVTFSRKFLPSLSAGAFEDPRLDIVIADGVEFVAQEGAPWDVIIVDSTDPEGPAEVLYTESFYRDCRSRLTPRGVLITQNGVPFVMPEAVSAPISSLNAVFEDVALYLADVPSYSGGSMAFGWAGRDPSVRETGVEVLGARLAALDLTPRYYTPEVHKAAFALPGHVAALIR